MERKICKTKTVNANEFITETYQLVLENEKYSIICTEKNKITKKTTVEKVINITANEKEAYKLFEYLSKYIACEGTLNDIVKDLMC